jgi:predicted lipid carrier protein YhbT
MITLVIQPILEKIVRHISIARPELFNRIGPHTNKDFLIDPTNLPYVFLLRPKKENPDLRLCHRSKIPEHNARISGTFLTLLKMIDGQLDGDALFFTRDLIIQGDTEAVVCLRNALDDMDGSVAEDIAALFPLCGIHTLSLFRNIKT